MDAIARLAFELPTSIADESEVVYRELIYPILERHGLQDCPGRPPATRGSLTSYYLTADPTLVALALEAVRRDPAWPEAWQEAEHRMGVAAGQLAASYRLEICFTPAGSGRSVAAGNGFLQGQWRSFSVPDGLPSSLIEGIFQDSKGRIWFQTHEAGVGWFDGSQVTTLTVDDGLAENTVSCILESRDGSCMWFGTPKSGLSLYDGVSFTTFTEADGLADDAVASLMEDGQGRLWITSRGPQVTRLDGGNLTVLTLGDGSPDHSVTALCEDDSGCIWFGTSAGAFRFDGHDMEEASSNGMGPGGPIHDIVRDRQGGL